MVHVLDHRFLVAVTVSLLRFCLSDALLPTSMKDTAKTVKNTRRDAAERRPYVVPAAFLIRAFSNAARNDCRDVRGTADCAVPVRSLR